MQKIPTLITLALLISFTISAQENISPASNKPDSEKENFMIVEKVAEYPCGVVKFEHYIKKHLKYPKSAKKNGVSGTVYVAFAINRDGSIDDQSVRIATANELKQKHPDLIVNKACELEAIRLLQECPDWTPARQKGIAVKTKIIMPIRF